MANLVMTADGLDGWLVGQVGDERHELVGALDAADNPKPARQRGQLLR
jgi:hypothetical protein